MKKAQPIRRSFMDRTFFQLVTIGWTERRLKSYDLQMGRYHSALPPGVAESFQLIDVKATGLLQHVALMIAGLGLIAPLVAQSEFEVGVVIAEISIYLLIAVGCLRCLALFNSQDLRRGNKALLAIARHELIIRRELYALCNRAAMAFTLLVFLLLPVLFFYRPVPLL